MDGRRLAAVAVRLAVGGIFLYAGILKARDPVGFAGSIAAYRILPYFGDYLVAAVLPWLEIVCGALLVAGVRYRGATLLLTLLDLVFMGALASVIVRGLDIDCGCFRQGGGATSPWVALGRDVVLFAALLFVLKGASVPPLRPCRRPGAPPISP